MTASASAARANRWSAVSIVARAARTMLGGRVFKIAFAASVFLAALWLLGRELRGSSLTAVVDAARATRPSAFFWAIVATAMSYGCLAVSEWWALRTVGRRLSAPRIGLVTFVAYALSNGLGFSMATGAAARLRFYRPWGLNTAEAAAVSVLAGLAVTLSGLVTAGIALLVVGDLPLAYRALGVLLVSLGALWFVRLPDRLWFLPGLRPLTPPRRLGVLALGGGVADWVFSGLALFVLLPGAAAADFLPFLAIFVFGSVVSAVSGVPGGVGVFDAIVLGLSHRFAVAHETAAALIVYRLIYAVGPLMITAAGLCAAQLVHGLRGARRAELKVVAAISAPTVFAALTFYLGAALLLAAANAPIRLASLQMGAELPRSALMSSVTGALLLVLAQALWRRREAAYYASLALLLAGAVGELWRGFGWISAGPLLALALLLAPCRFAFDRRSVLTRDLASPEWLAAIALSGAAAWILARIVAADAQALGRPWWSLAVTTGRSGALALAATLAAMALIAAVWSLLRAARPGFTRPEPQALERAKSIILDADHVSCDAFLVLMGDKALTFSPSGRSFVMYRPRAGRWIAMGDPVGPAQDRPAAIEAFAAAADEHDAHPVFYAVEEESLADLVAAGFLPVKIGESASVDVARFDLKGHDKQDLRLARNRAQRHGLVFEVFALGDPATPWAALANVSHEWLSAHAGAEKGFSLGAFDLGYLNNFPIAVLRQGADVVAFANIVASPDRSKFGVDLMRARRDGPSSAMDALFIELIAWGRDQGYGRFELGMAPLAGLEMSGVDSWSRRVERWIYHAGEGLYGFEGLRAYKDKYGPEWRPIFLAAPPGLRPLALLTDVALLTSGGARGLARRPRPEGGAEP